jgi:hypothetical protein
MLKPLVDSGCQEGVLRRVFKEVELRAEAASRGAKLGSARWSVQRDEAAV